MTGSNRKSYESPQFVRGYTAMIRNGLTMPEQWCLDQIPASSRGSVLDIGVGSGRTTGPLSRAFSNYIGIDYSAPMIEVARRNFPGCDLRVMDAGQMRFDEVFDSIVFSFNGIDYGSVHERHKIMRRIASLLKMGGYFLYSTHNLAHTRVRHWRNQLLVRELFVPLRRLRYLPFRLRRFREQVDAGRHVAYVNDPGHGFNLITTYVDLRYEHRVLNSMGFTVEATMGNSKRTAGYDAEDCWVYILARKTGGPKPITELP